MARFPTRESDIIALAHEIIAGFLAHPDIFPNPPVPAGQFQQQYLNGFLTEADGAVQADIHAAEMHDRKDASLATLVDIMARSLRYAENAVANPDQLALIGWSAPKSRALAEPPGQCRSLEAVRQGPGWVYFDWKEPAEGGKPAAYQIQRREMPGGDWQPAGTAAASEATVTGQPTGKTLEYRVYAFNKAGDGPFSNVVEAVL